MRRCLVLYGLTCILGQVLALRELSVAFHGNELVYGAALAVWLLLSAAGSGLLGQLAERRMLGVRAFALALAGAGILVPAAVLLTRLAHLLVVGSEGVIPSVGGILLCATIAVGPLCLALGFFFAMASAIVFRGNEPPAAQAARVYIFESLGTFLGGALLTYVFLQALDALQISLAVAAADCFAAFVVWRRGARSPRLAGWALVMIAGLCVVAVATPVGAVIHFASLASRYPGRVLRYSADSPYGRVDVVESKGQIEFYQSGGLAGTTNMDRSAEETAFLALLAHPAPRRALIIGGAVSGVLRKALEAPWLQIDYVELDPALVQAALEFASSEDRAALNSPRVRVYGGTDGRLFVKRARSAYDVIICAVPNPTTGMLNRFYTAEFFLEANRAMTRGGVLALYLDGAPAYMSAPHRALATSIYATLRASFPGVLALPSDNGIYLFASSRRETLADTGAWVARARAWRLHPSWLSEGTLRELVNAARRADLLRRLGEGRRAPLNSDLRPVAYYHALLLWAEAFEFRGARLLTRALRLDLWTCLMGVVLATGLLAFLAAFAREPLRIGLAATRVYAGLAGFVLELVLVFAFQSIYGYAYGHLGVLFGAFMVGLTLGGLAARGHAPSELSAWLLVVLQMALAVAAAAFVPILLVLSRSGPLLSQAGAVVVIPFLNLCVGGLIGAQYPIAVAALAGHTQTAGGMIAARLYALDLAGACLGALLGGAILIPVMGIPRTCWLMCAVSLASIPLLVLAQRRR